MSASPKSGSLIRTRTPGIYRKVGAKRRPYVVVYRAAGKHRKESCRTLDEARALKRAREVDRDRGEFQPRSQVMLRDYLTEWIETYQGNGRRGFREGTRAGYRRLLNNYAHAYFPKRLRLTEVTPLHLSDWVRWLADHGKRGKPLSDATIANAVIPVRAALGTAKRDGLIRHNPAQGIAIPRRERIHEDADEYAKALSREQLAALLAIAPPRDALLFETLACTGLRISEAIGLQRRHLILDGERPHLRVRRGVVQGRVEPPKTKYGRRNVPLPQTLVHKLRVHVATLDDDDEAIVFTNRDGGLIDTDNLRRRVVKPLMQEVGAPWAAFHSLRHTYASIQLARGVSLLQLSRALGHHSAAFTLTRYTHLLPGDEVPALDLGAELGDGARDRHEPARGVETRSVAAHRFVVHQPRTLSSPA